MLKGVLRSIANFTYSLKRAELDWVNRIFNTVWARILAIAVLSLLITLLTTVSLQHLPDKLEVGAVATYDIKADRNYEIVDEEATSSSRQEAVASVLPVYDLDVGLENRAAKQVEQAFEVMREDVQRTLSKLPKKRRKRSRVIGAANEKRLRARLEELLGEKVSLETWRALLREGFSRRLAKTTAAAVRDEMKKPIIASGAELGVDAIGGIAIRRVQRKDGMVEVEKELTLADPKGVLSLDEARAKVQARAGNPAIALAKNLIVPNLVSNSSETENRRQQAAESVKNAILKVKAGEMIIRNGARYEKWNIKVLNAIRKERQSGAFSREFFGTWLLALIAMLIPFTFARRFFRRFHPTKLDDVLMAAMALLILIIMRIMMLMLPAIREAFFSQVPASAINYIIPVAGGAMAVRMFLNTENSLVFAMVLSILAGLFAQSDVQFTTFVLLSSMAAMFAIAHVDRRSLIIRAGLITGLANVLIVVGISLLDVAGAGGSLSLSGLVWSAAFGFLGGLGSAVFVMIIVPAIESLMNYTTDIKLLELANLNHPLLRELIVTAPGTYHHSHLVGILGEAAAEAIGANALLVRVGAYYHDIGKMRKPPYFIENVRNAENRHEKLTPHMSALIVQAHVKDGIEMAQAARLPKVITDMIPQHHGTRMISFFYGKAKDAEDPNIQRIDPKEFQYPGPKPQSREAAILMLSDVVEAQIRSLKEKSPVRIEQSVRKIIDDVFRESQLDECELTLKDLDNIHKAFVRILLGIYHQRIEYPDKEKGEKTRESVGSGAADESSLSENGSSGTHNNGGRKKAGE